MATSLIFLFFHTRRSRSPDLDRDGVKEPTGGTRRCSDHLVHLLTEWKDATLPLFPALSFLYKTLTGYTKTDGVIVTLSTGLFCTGCEAHRLVLRSRHLELGVGRFHIWMFGWWLELNRDCRVSAECALKLGHLLARD